MCCQALLDDEIYISAAHAPIEGYPASFSDDRQPMRKPALATFPGRGPHNTNAAVLLSSQDTEADSGIDSKRSDARKQARLSQQRTEIQNLASHIREATGYIRALVRMLDAMNDIGKGYKKQFDIPEDLNTLYKTFPPVQETFDLAGTSISDLADRVSEYADGVSEALARVRNLAHSGETCLVSQVPSLLAAAEILQGIYEVIEDCKFGDSSMAHRLGTREDARRIAGREQELSRLKHGPTGWARELEGLDIEY
ncbi:hypothetical protein AUEXF2481DRAFT_191609 [Aureobasidium subglaciale EXF-2481]|uniref:Uncharacterized protein n=1 Tax=Aureobasidium subglaciale (strain EXF-2481) TaxID=1043005 RepID=A0A074ZMV4_AURSE|nr:uncharacterized protein AUEXF2481DRAFT_191609 [Aureobasidium subglaciale EXF-2481]KEQ99701.1 hypothetical protein AUEXF2481DRAFT_191609 [Aureobasidium subglaciale EXF-2481]